MEKIYRIAEAAKINPADPQPNTDFGIFAAYASYYPTGSTGSPAIDETPPLGVVCGSTFFK